MSTTSTSDADSRCKRCEHCGTPTRKYTLDEDTKEEIPACCAACSDAIHDSRVACESAECNDEDEVGISFSGIRKRLFGEKKTPEEEAEEKKKKGPDAYPKCARSTTNAKICDSVAAGKRLAALLGKSDAAVNGLTEVVKASIRDSGKGMRIANLIANEIARRQLHGKSESKYATTEIDIDIRASSASGIETEVYVDFFVRDAAQNEKYRAAMFRAVPMHDAPLKRGNDKLVTKKLDRIFCTFHEWYSRPILEGRDGIRRGNVFYRAFEGFHPRHLFREVVSNGVPDDSLLDAAAKKKFYGRFEGCFVEFSKPKKRKLKSMPSEVFCVAIDAAVAAEDVRVRDLYVDDPKLKDDCTVDLSVWKDRYGDLVQKKIGVEIAYVRSKDVSPAMVLTLVRRTLLGKIDALSTAEKYLGGAKTPVGHDVAIAVDHLNALAKNFDRYSTGLAADASQENRIEQSAVIDIYKAIHPGSQQEVSVVGDETSIDWKRMRDRFGLYPDEMDMVMRLVASVYVERPVYISATKTFLIPRRKFGEYFGVATPTKKLSEDELFAERTKSCPKREEEKSKITTPTVKEEPKKVTPPVSPQLPPRTPTPPLARPTEAKPGKDLPLSPEEISPPPPPPPPAVVPVTKEPVARSGSPSPSELQAGAEKLTKVAEPAPKKAPSESGILGVMTESEAFRKRQRDIQLADFCEDEENKDDPKCKEEEKGGEWEDNDKDVSNVAYSHDDAMEMVAAVFWSED